MDSTTGGRSVDAIGGLVGTAAFVGAWMVAGALTDGYAPLRQPISDLAAFGAPTHVLMSAGMVTFGVAVAAYARALHRSVESRAWIAATTCALATLGVAAVPLGAGCDGLHGAFAGLGYLALAATPLLAVRPLQRHGWKLAAGASVATGLATGACLITSSLAPDPGFFQRVGLLIGDTWIAVSALMILTGRLSAGSRAESVGWHAGLAPRGTEDPCQPANP